MIYAPIMSSFLFLCEELHSADVMFLLSPIGVGSLLEKTSQRIPIEKESIWRRKGYEKESASSASYPGKARRGCSR